MVSFSSERLWEHWFFKYKLYHIPFWAFYHFMRGVAEFGFSISTMGLFTPRFVMFLFYIFIPASGVYFNLYYLLPKYLGKGKLAQYVVFLLLCIVITSMLLLGSYFFGAFMIGKPLDYFCAFDTSSGYDLFHILITEVLPTTAGAILLGLSIKLVKNSLLAQERQKILEKEKLETELKFLKYQFNPHFLFNTINSIFFLIHKDPKMASTALADFSELLRYQLYECNDKQIPLDNEIAYLENFVALEKLRKNQGFEVSLDIDPQNQGRLGIAPFILMTFVENAFKHVSKHTQLPNWVKVKLVVDEHQQLQFEVFNSKSDEEDTAKEAVNYGGIGLQNVKRRLDLVYPEKYKLMVENNEDIFKVKLQLGLLELPTTHVAHLTSEPVAQQY